MINASLNNNAVTLVNFSGPRGASGNNATPLNMDTNVFTNHSWHGIKTPPFDIQGTATHLSIVNLSATL